MAAQRAGSICRARIARGPVWDASREIVQLSVNRRHRYYGRLMVTPVFRHSGYTWSGIGRHDLTSPPGNLMLRACR